MTVTGIYMLLFVVFSPAKTNPVISTFDFVIGFTVLECLECLNYFMYIIFKTTSFYNVYIFRRKYEGGGK